MLFDDLKDFVAEVDVARRRVDVDDEREQRYEVEERRLAAPAAEEGEEADGEVEEADEAEDQVRVVDLQLGDAVGEVEGAPAARDDHRHFLPDAAEALLQPLDRGGRLVADDRG